jgi:ADP-heptose:LPS heptosyltransferase
MPHPAAGRTRRPGALAAFEAGLTSPVPPAFNRDTLLDTILLLCQCDLFLAGNTDLFHVAVAEGVPSVGLFGSQTQAHWLPATRPRSTVLKVSPGKQIDTATLMAAIARVRKHDGGNGGDDTVGAAGPSLDPLPAPGA